MDNNKKIQLNNRFKHFLNGDIPDKHKVDDGLRCFYNIKKKTDKGIRVFRCNKKCDGKTIFCNKHTFDKNLIKKNSVTNKDNHLFNLIEAYLSDPTILDHKSDLATLRALLNSYLKNLTETDNLTKKQFVKKIEDICNDTIYSHYQDKYDRLIDLFQKRDDIFDSKVIKNINEIVNNIGRCVERISKINVQENYLLTPEGLKIFLRAIVELLRVNIEDEILLLKVQEGLMQISITTKGNLQMVTDKVLENNNVIDVEKK